LIQLFVSFQRLYALPMREVLCLLGLPAQEVLLPVKQFHPGRLIDSGLLRHRCLMNGRGKSLKGD
jgi:hypothetical protein